MPSSSEELSDSEPDFSDAEPCAPPAGPTLQNNPQPSDNLSGDWDLDYIEDTKLCQPNGSEGRVERWYELKFTGYSDTEWQPEDNVGAIDLVRCFWDNRLKPWELNLEAQRKVIEEELSDDDEPPGPSDPSPTLPRRRLKRRRTRRATRDPDLASSESDDDDDEPESESEPELEPDLGIAEELGLSSFQDLLKYKPQDPTIKAELKKLKAEFSKLPRLPQLRRPPVSQGPPPAEASTSSSRSFASRSTQRTTPPKQRIVVKPLAPDPQPSKKRPRSPSASQRELINQPEKLPPAWKGSTVKGPVNSDLKKMLRRNNLAARSACDIPVPNQSCPISSASSVRTNASAGQAQAARRTTPRNTPVASPVADIPVPTQISPTVSAYSIETNTSGGQAPAASQAAAQPRQQQAVSEDIPVQPRL